MQDNERENVRKVIEYFNRSGVVLTEEEKKRIIVADYGWGKFELLGASYLDFVNNERYSVREIVLFPGQSTSEHCHPSIGQLLGKTETARCQYGTIYAYMEGEPTSNPKGKPPEGLEKFYTVWHEIVMKPGDQLTVPTGTRHWYQAGDEGAVFIEYASTLRDEYDVHNLPWLNDNCVEK